MLLSLVVMLGGVRQARELAVATRAQAAADAAALAAIAESASLGAGAHPYEARRFAEMNGAELISCLCYPGATAVQVEVSFEGARARARAVLDADLLVPGRTEGGLHPTLARSLALLLERSGGRVWLSSGFRSPAAQRRLWAEALEEHVDPEAADDWVARPGTSLHEIGLAVDLGGDLEVAERLVAELGLPLHQPVPNERWHFELIGGRPRAAV